MWVWQDAQLSWGCAMGHAQCRLRSANLAFKRLAGTNSGCGKHACLGTGGRRAALRLQGGQAADWLWFQGRTRPVGGASQVRQLWSCATVGVVRLRAAAARAAALAQGSTHSFFWVGGEQHARPRAALPGWAGRRPGWHARLAVPAHSLMMEWSPRPLPENRTM